MKSAPSSRRVVAFALAAATFATTLPAAASSTTASGVLAQIPVATEVRTGYQRSLFPHWLDADGNGCDTRREVLLVEALTAPADCRSNSGVWRSVYDGLRFDDATRLDIDHVVALAEAWDSGARKWTTARRAAFANDLNSPWSLVAVSASSNRQKSDKDITGWNATTTEGRCFLAVATVITKWRWSLTVDRRERDALAKQITTCGNPTVTLPKKYQDSEVPVTASPGGQPVVTPSPEPSTVTPPIKPPSGGSVAPVAGQCAEPYPVKGNEGSDRIYHLPGSTYYSRTYAEVCFASAEAAQAAGFRAPR
jgi:hypothetical protein